MIRGKYRIGDVAKICTFHFKGLEVKVKTAFVYRGSQNIFLSPQQQVRSTPPPPPPPPTPLPSKVRHVITYSAILINSVVVRIGLPTTTVLLRLRDVYPGTGFFHPGSQWIRNKEFKYF
jgi:hypothetical protein